VLKTLTTNDLLIDVRTAKEFEDSTVKGAINIPVDELRQRLDELPRDRNIYIFCQIGLRGYLAQRILLQHNFNNVKNISGGYFLYKAIAAERRLLEAANM